MEREETNSSHYVASRTALWCPICGAKENHGCTPVKGLRFSGHNLSATGQVSRPALTPSFWGGCEAAAKAAPAKEGEEESEGGDETAKAARKAAKKARQAAAKESAAAK